MALHKVLMQNSATATGNGVTVAVGSKSGVLLDVSGISTATITVEGKLENAWAAIDSYAMSGGGRSTTITSDGLYWVPAPGLLSVRARISAYTSGTIIVWGGATETAYCVVPS